MALIVAVWFPVTIALCLGFLPVAKGALVALQWAPRMHGFGGESDGGDPLPERLRGVGLAGGGDSGAAA